MRNKINLLREFSIPLILGVVTAVFWANLEPDGYAAFIHAPVLGHLSFHFITNEIFMVFFFGIAAVEITMSCLPGGDLNPPNKAVNPLFATIGGVLGPVGGYFLLNHFIGSPEMANGWGIPTATDIALAWLVARMAFGDNHPVIAFILLLAIADDAIGLVIIAVFYSDPSVPAFHYWLLLTLAGMLSAFLMRKMKTKSYWPYLALSGSASWVGLHNANLHPALALVFIVPFLPHPWRETQHLFEADPRDRSTLHAFEADWKIVVDFGLFMFGLANAGVAFSGVGTATWLVLASLLAGKTIGIFLFSLAGEKLGFRLPDGMGYRSLFIAGLISGIGFTVSLFIAGEAFTDPVIQGAAKMGAMLSIVAAPVALVMANILKIERDP